MEVKDYPFRFPKEQKGIFENNGPFEFDELLTHVEKVAEVLAEVESDRYPDEQHIKKVMAENEGHGILVESSFNFSSAYTRPLLDAGYVVMSCDSATSGNLGCRAFIMPFKVDGETPVMFPDIESEVDG